MSLNEKEKKILAAIRRDPFISQQKLADEISLSRSATANLISGLVKKEHLLGKAYVLNEKKPVVCIGAANIDRRYLLEEKLVPHSTNDVKERSSVGGCARSIAENLGRLDIETTLLSIVGNDACWQQIKAESEHFMDISQVDVVENGTTGTFMEVVSVQGEMVLGLADMDIYHSMTPEWLTRHLSVLKQAEYLVADLNLPKETLEFLIAFKIKHQIPLMLITVSIPKMENIPTCLKGVDLLITKHDETAEFFNTPVNSQAELEQAALRWLEFGMKNVVINKHDSAAIVVTDKKKIYYYEDQKNFEERYHWGVNEAYCAGMVYAHTQDKPFFEGLLAGLANAYYTARTVQLIRPNLSTMQLEEDVRLFSRAIKHYQM
ncbi:carbohydrate kinase [Carnobacterium sp.]|uniref:carbohydrate kinase n=1 Tax=Carnobacterium sp. TaxID=48221 RepID=UPI0028AB44DC|nr:carbohydrate kinase [Carnobacterium sp.]